MSRRDEFEMAQAGLLERFGVRADSRFLDVEAVSGPAHVLVTGEGPPLVMVPGFGDPAAMWAPLMPSLEGFTLYAIDRPCFGLTGTARHSTGTLRALAVSFLEQVLDGLGLHRPLFVANSMGSLWSLWFALDRPARVRAMTHIGCPALLLDTSAPLPMRLLSVPGLGALLMRIVPPSAKQVDDFAAMAGADLSELPELRNLLVVMQKLPGVPEALRELLHAVLRVRGARPEIVLTAEQLAKVQQPVQLIWGERDPFGGPDVGRRAARLLPDCEFHLLPNAGHVPWVDNTGPVGDLARAFLRRHRTADDEMHLDRA